MHNNTCCAASCRRLLRATISSSPQIACSHDAHTTQIRPSLNKTLELKKACGNNPGLLGRSWLSLVACPKCCRLGGTSICAQTRSCSDFWFVETANLQRKWTDNDDIPCVTCVGGWESYPIKKCSINFTKAGGVSGRDMKRVGSRQ